MMGSLNWLSIGQSGGLVLDVPLIIALPQLAPVTFSLASSLIILKDTNYAS